MKFATLTVGMSSVGSGWDASSWTNLSGYWLALLRTRCDTVFPRQVSGRGCSGGSHMRSIIANDRIGFASWPYTTRPAAPQGGKLGSEPTSCWAKCPGGALAMRECGISRIAERGHRSLTQEHG
jgi:hypothetical protein